MLLNSGDRLTFLNPLDLLPGIYDEKHASFTVKEMFEFVFTNHYRNFQLIFKIQTVMNNHDCLYKNVFLL